MFRPWTRLVSDYIAARDRDVSHFRFDTCCSHLPIRISVSSPSSFLIVLHMVKWYRKSLIMTKPRH
jgi:hypothetical protein